FRGAFALGVSAYIRHRRMLRAKHLLLNTDQPIAAIARAVGSTDLTLFNRWAHRELGASPRRVRSGGMQERTRAS
ncbi:MAG: helix-turn-helix domain-containing protein, partial [Planctomycetes bacterium]|nr:helix-turn-helix domain-containing protein [Planctomycetota bacterium]